MKNLTDFEKRTIELMRNATSMVLEKAPYRYHRQLVKSNGVEFYIYQGPLYDFENGNENSTHVTDLDGNTLGRVRPSIYWDLVREFRDRETSKSLNKFMGVEK